MINILKFIKNIILKIIKQMALENKKLSAYDDLASANIDTTTKLVVLTGATKVNNNLPVTNFIEDSLTSTSVVKPLSAKQGKALQDAKAPIANPTFTGTVNGITKSMVGLGNVDNTSDENKPISAAQAAGLAPKVSPVFSGIHLNIRYLHAGDILITDDVVHGSDNSSTPVVLPRASTCKGKVITTLCDVDDLSYTVNSFSGDFIVVSAAAELVTTTNIPHPYNSKTFISDGVNLWYQI